MSCSRSPGLRMSRYFKLRTEPRNLGSRRVVGKTTESIFSEYHDGKPPTKTYPLDCLSPKAMVSLSLRGPYCLTCWVCFSLSPTLWFPFDRIVFLVLSTTSVVSAPFFTISTRCHNLSVSTGELITWPPRPQLYLKNSVGNPC